MERINAREVYLKAQSLGHKEIRDLESHGLSPYPAVLEEVFPAASHTAGTVLPIVEIPADRIIGTVSAGRTGVFSSSFMPLPDAGSEFASKWIALCEAHLSDTGIHDPIECVEYLGDFYVREGHKRVSVLRYFGAVRIPAKVRRLLPPEKNSPREIAYYEFLDFYRDSHVYDIQFTVPGDYAKLLFALGKKGGEEWSGSETKRFVSVYSRFREAFQSLSAKDRSLSAENALLLFLKVYPYEQLAAMSSPEIKKALAGLWQDIRTSSESEAITVKTAPEEEKKKSVISKLISASPKNLNIALICQGDTEKSPWTRGHVEGMNYLAETLGDSISVKTYFHADTAKEAETLIDAAVSDGAGLVFTATPQLLDVTLKAAVMHPKIRFYNCSACQHFSSVKSYYCRIYEGKFITGMIAGALADNDLVGYIGSYPIMGVPAAVNAFALGARMTNPRVRILLEWSSTEYDCVKKLREKGVKVISNRDIPTPDPQNLNQSYIGIFMIDEAGGLTPIASPVWMWGRLYENIVRAVLTNSTDKNEQAVNYWWGMDLGVIDVALSDFVPEGVRRLAEIFSGKLKNGDFDIFAQKITAQDGSIISDGAVPLSSLEILKMDRLMDAVEGHIPEYGELLPFSRGLVRALGVHRERIPPETES
ncbi:MAG: BMP family ABC transporter substrate-binding protein [Oscillospiraceae bacterium]|nr:BMP family ABC transporter substrate-binding protein [Oscillospiraceae bacterium]